MTSTQSTAAVNNTIHQTCLMFKIVSAITVLNFNALQKTLRLAKYQQHLLTPSMVEYSCNNKHHQFFTSVIAKLELMTTNTRRNAIRMCSQSHAPLVLKCKLRSIKGEINSSRLQHVVHLSIL